MAKSKEQEKGSKERNKAESEKNPNEYIKRLNERAAKPENVGAQEPSSIRGLTVSDEKATEAIKAHKKVSYPVSPGRVEEAIKRISTSLSNERKVPAIKAISERDHLDKIAEKFRRLFVDYVVSWIKDNATTEEARHIELTAKQRLNELNKESATPLLRKTLTIKNIGGRHYFCEDYQKPNGKMTSHSLGTSLPPDLDLSQYSISPKAKEFLGF